MKNCSGVMSINVIGAVSDDIAILVLCIDAAHLQDYDNRRSQPETLRAETHSSSEPQQ